MANIIVTLIQISVVYQIRENNFQKLLLYLKIDTN